MASNYVNLNGDHLEDPGVRSKSYRGQRTVPPSSDNFIQGSTPNSKSFISTQNFAGEMENRSSAFTIGQSERITGKPDIFPAYRGEQKHHGGSPNQHNSSMRNSIPAGIRGQHRQPMSSSLHRKDMSSSFNRQDMYFQNRERPHMSVTNDRPPDYSTADQVHSLANTMSEVLKKIEEIKDFAGLINEMNFKCDQVLQQNNELRDVVEDLRYDVSVLRNDTLRPVFNENDRFYENEEHIIDNRPKFERNEINVTYDGRSQQNDEVDRISSALSSNQDIEEQFQQHYRETDTFVEPKHDVNQLFENKESIDNPETKLSTERNQEVTVQPENNQDTIVNPLKRKGSTKHNQADILSQESHNEKQDHTQKYKGANAHFTELNPYNRALPLNDSQGSTHNHNRANTDSSEPDHSKITLSKSLTETQRRTDNNNKGENTNLNGHSHGNKSLAERNYGTRGQETDRKYRCKRTDSTEDNRFSSSSTIKEEEKTDIQNEEFLNESSENRVDKENGEQSEEIQDTPATINQREEHLTDEEDDLAVPKDDHFLEHLSLTENAKARDCLEPKSSGTDTVICIDTSESMAGKPFQQCVDFVNKFVDYIEEWATEFQIEENIAIVHFGSDARILQQLTNDYNKVRESIENLSTKGPTPMMTGLVIAMSALFNRGGPVSVHDRQINPRVILLSDGHATDYRIFDGPDVLQKNGYSTEKIKARLDDFADRVRLEDRYIITIPVGDNPCMEILSPLAETTGGFVSSLDNVRELSRSFFLEVIISQTRHAGITEEIKSNRREIANIVKSLQSGQHVTSEEIDKIVSKVITETEEQIEIEKIRENQRNEIDEESEMEVGLRVRRGADWMWGDQDGFGTGTVIGHKSRGTMQNSRGYVRVKWDCGNIGRYRHGVQNAYDLIVVDEPRILPEEVLVAEGVYVKKGKDWEWEGQDGGDEFAVGCVYHIEDEGIVHVRWQNGMRGNYRFGGYGKMDLEIVTPVEYIELKRQRQQNMEESDGSLNIQGRSNVRDSALNINTERSDQGAHSLEADTGLESQLLSPTEEVKFEEVVPPGVWQYKQGGEWKDYAEEDNQRIEKQYIAKGKGTLIVNVNGKLCRVLIHTNKQKNPKTGEETDIRRIEK